MRIGRTAAVIAALACLPGVGAAQAHKRHARPVVSCYGQFCTTHFRVTITGEQITAWRIPYQHIGVASCYQVGYVEGMGGQRIRFSGSGLVEASGSRGGEPSFEVLSGGHVVNGIGIGSAELRRYGHKTFHGEPGQCGGEAKTVEEMRGCGSERQRWKYFLTTAHHRSVELDGVQDPVPLVAPLDLTYCPLFGNGLPGGGDLTDLYNGFDVSLGDEQLFDRKLAKIVLTADRTFNQQVPTPLGITGTTVVQWTITLTRVAHARFY